MATVFNLPVSRAPSVIMCDLATVKARLAEFDALTEMDDDEDRAMCALDDRRCALEAEAQAAIYAATGVSWDLWWGTLA